MPHRSLNLKSLQHEDAMIFALLGGREIETLYILTSTNNRKSECLIDHWT